MHCLNSTCLRASKCVRYQMSLLAPRDRKFFPALNPVATGADGERCTVFVAEEPLQFARGITHLVDQVPMVYAQAISRQIRNYLGRNTYYRIMNKTRLISPEEQNLIKGIFRRNGVTQDPVYDELVEHYDFSIDR